MMITRDKKIITRGDNSHRQPLRAVWPGLLKFTHESSCLTGCTSTKPPQAANGCPTVRFSMFKLAFKSLSKLTPQLGQSWNRQVFNNTFLTIKTLDDPASGINVLSVLAAVYPYYLHYVQECPPLYINIDLQNTENLSVDGQWANQGNGTQNLKYQKGLIFITLLQKISLVKANWE